MKVLYFKIFVFFLIVTGIPVDEGFGQNYYKVEETDFSKNETDEVAPVMFRDGLVFVSNRKTKVWKSDITPDEKPLLDIYFVNKKDNKKWNAPEILSIDLTTRFHDGPVAFTPDGREIIFSRNSGKGSGEDNKLGLFIASINSTGFSNVRSFFPFTEKYEAYNITHPYVSPDGNYLFFAADVPGGYGRYDIYRCTKRRSRWSEPENLGPVVNTERNEVFPFYHPMGRLYFASDGHEGLGGDDIFYADEIEDKWLQPVNVGEPINSKRDDFALIIDEELNTGYFTSTRNRSHDIFSFSSTLPQFESCNEVQENNYCFVFSEAGSMDLDTTSLKYEWDLGDGTKVRNLTARHCFEGPGNYFIQLNVIDTLTGDIYFSEATYNFNLEDIEQPYITAPDTAEIFQEIDFDGSETFLKDVTIERYVWDFGDGYKKIGENVTHTFKKTGTYQVKLGVESLTNEEGEDPQKKKFCSYKTITILDQNAENIAGNP